MFKFEVFCFFILEQTYLVYFNKLQIITYTLQNKKYFLYALPSNFL